MGMWAVEVTARFWGSGVPDRGTVMAAAATVLKKKSVPYLGLVRAIILHAAKAVATKTADRDDLQVGTHVCNLTIAGDVDGTPFAETFNATVSVAEDSVRSGSGPTARELLARILDTPHLGAATKKKILAAVEHGPEPSVESKAVADSVLRTLGAKETKTCRGNVSVRF